jgi:transposase
MGAAYSIDLRLRVMSHYSEFGNKTETARVFKVHYDTITNWEKRIIKDNLKASKPGPNNASPRKLNPQDVCKYVQNKADMTLHELAEIFKVSHVAIWKVLRKHGYVNKKNSIIQRKKRSTES